MTNLYTGDFSPDGYIFYNGSGTGYTETRGTKTTLPIAVATNRLYKFNPVGGTSSRCRCIEILKNGGRRDYQVYPDGGWTEYEYVPDDDVAAIQIYYRGTVDTATGLNFIDVTVDSFSADYFIMSEIAIRTLTAIPAAKLEIDLDPDAERLIILDRESAQRLYFCKINELTKVITLPLKYALNPLLTCIILDNNLAYTGAILDGVRAEVTDLSQ